MAKHNTLNVADTRSNRVTWIISPHSSDGKSARLKTDRDWLEISWGDRHPNAEKVYIYSKDVVLVQIQRSVLYRFSVIVARENRLFQSLLGISPCTLIGSCGESQKLLVVGSTPTMGTALRTHKERDHQNCQYLLWQKWKPTSTRLENEDTYYRVAPVGIKIEQRVYGEMVSQMTFNHFVFGSNPNRPTKYSQMLSRFT